MINKYEGKEYVVSKDVNNFYHCEECVLPPAASYYLGKKVILGSISRNTRSSKKYYPLFAKFKVK